MLGAVAGAVGVANVVGGFLSAKEQRKSIDRQNAIIQQNKADFFALQGLKKEQLQYEGKRTFAVNELQSFASGMQEDPRLIQANLQAQKERERIFYLETKMGASQYDSMMQSKPNAFAQGLNILSNSFSSSLNTYNALKV